MNERVVSFRLRLSHLLIGVTMLLVGVGAGVAAQQAFAQDGGTFYACAKNNNGQLRLVGDPGSCDRSEYVISWSSGGGGSEALQGEINALWNCINQIYYAHSYPLYIPSGEGRNFTEPPGCVQR